MRQCCSLRQPLRPKRGNDEQRRDADRHGLRKQEPEAQHWNWPIYHTRCSGPFAAFRYSHANSDSCGAKRGHSQRVPVESRAFVNERSSQEPFHERKRPIDRTRRNLIVATSVVGGAASVGAAVPFVASMWPSERAKAAGAPVEVDICKHRAGRAEGRRMARQAGVGRPAHQGNARVAEGRRTASSPIRTRSASKQPDYAKNEQRAQQARIHGDGRRLHAPRLLAAVEDGRSQRRRWAPTGRAASTARATARSSTIAGRVFQGAPAPINLRGAAVHVPVRHHAPDRRRQEGGVDHGGIG